MLKAIVIRLSAMRMHRQANTLRRRRTVRSPAQATRPRAADNVAFGRLPRPSAAAAIACESRINAINLDAEIVGIWAQIHS